MSHAWVLTAALLALPACASAPEPTTGEPAARDGLAALAQLDVDNRTDRPLAIAYRTATGPPREVVVGRVDAETRARVAPVIAGEPIILIARAPDGSAIELQPRAIGIGSRWTWIIAEDTRFVEPEREGG